MVEMSKQEQIQGYLEQGNIKKAEQEIHSLHELDARMVVLDVLIQIFYLEKKQNATDTIFGYSRNIDLLVQHYSKVKLLLRRLEFDMPQQEELYKYCMEHNVSEYMLAVIVGTNLFGQKKVYKKLMGMFREKAGYFHSLYKYLEETEDG